MTHEEAAKILAQYPLVGIRYNVVRRPLSGGRGTIVRHKAKGIHPEETKESFYGRVEEYIKEEPGHYFIRWNVPISSEDIKVFRQQCLDPLLEQLCDWWGWILISNGGQKNVSAKLGMPDGSIRFVHSSVHWRHPFGVFNPMDQGFESDVDGYLETGSEVGLTRVDELFPEL